MNTNSQWMIRFVRMISIINKMTFGWIDNAKIQHIKISKYAHDGFWVLLSQISHITTVMNVLYKLTRLQYNLFYLVVSKCMRQNCHLISYLQTDNDAISD